MRFGKPSITSKASALLKSTMKGQQGQTAAVDQSDDVTRTATVEDQIHEMSVFLALRLGRSLLRTLQERMKDRQRGSQVQPGGSAAATARSPPSLSAVEAATKTVTSPASSKQNDVARVRTATSFKAGYPSSLDASSVEPAEASPVLSASIRSARPSRAVGSLASDPSPMDAAIAEDKAELMAEKPKILHRREGDRVLALGDDFFTEDRTAANRAKPATDDSAEADKVEATGSADLPVVDVVATAIVTGAVPEEALSGAPIPSTVSLEFGRPLEVERTSSPPLSPDVARKVEQQQHVIAKALETTPNTEILEAEAKSKELPIEAASKSESSGSSFMALESLTTESLLEDISPESGLSFSVGTESPQNPTSEDSKDENMDASVRVEDAISASFSSSMSGDDASLYARAETVSGSEVAAASDATPGDTASEVAAKVGSSSIATATSSGFVMLGSPTSAEEPTASSLPASKDGTDKSTNLVPSGSSDADAPSDSSVSGTGFTLRRNSTSLDGSNVSTFTSSSSSTALSGSMLMEAAVDIHEEASLSMVKAQDSGEAWDEDVNVHFSGLFSSERSDTVDKAVLESLESTFALNGSIASDDPIGSASDAPESVESARIPPNSLESMIYFLQALEKEDASASSAGTTQVDAGLTLDIDPASFRFDTVAASAGDISIRDLEMKQSVETALVDPKIETPDAEQSISVSTPVRKYWSPYGQSWIGLDKVESPVNSGFFDPERDLSTDEETSAKADSALPAELVPTELSASKHVAPIDCMVHPPGTLTEAGIKTPRTKWSPYGKRWTSQSSGERPVPEEQTETHAADERPSDASTQTNWSPFGRVWTAPLSGEPTVFEPITGSAQSRDESAVASEASSAGRWNPFKTKADSSMQRLAELGAREASTLSESNSIAYQISTVEGSQRGDLSLNSLQVEGATETFHAPAVDIQPSLPLFDPSFPKDKWNPFQSKRQEVAEAKNSSSKSHDEASSLPLLSNDGDLQRPGSSPSGSGSENQGLSAGGLNTISPAIRPEGLQVTRSTSTLKDHKPMGKSVSTTSLSLGYQWHGDNWASSTLKPNMTKPPSLKDSDLNQYHPLHRTESGGYVWYTIPKYPELPHWQKFAKFSGISWTPPDHGD
jgi:hypothetical protein